MTSSDRWQRSPATLFPGDEVGSPGLLLSDRYELGSLIGAGGMGEVWEARHLALEKIVAVKLLRGLRSGGASTGRARLLQEARVLVTLRHEAIVEVFDFGETDSGVPYFVMERVEGGSLAELIERRGALSPREVVDMGIALADGLARAHAAGIIHRDVKPDNVLVSFADGGKLRPKLVDFGVAFVPRESSARLRTTEGLVGTPEYMAPESIRGVESHGLVDVWGLGLTLYEAVTGVSPFRATDPISAFRRVLDEDVPPIERVDMDPALARILGAALRKDPAARTGSLVELGAALRAWKVGRRATVEAPRATTPAHDEDAPVSLDALIREKLRG